MYGGRNGGGGGDAAAEVEVEVEVEAVGRDGCGSRELVYGLVREVVVEMEVVEVVDVVVEVVVAVGVKVKRSRSGRCGVGAPAAAVELRSSVSERLNSTDVGDGKKKLGLERLRTRDAGKIRGSLYLLTYLSILWA